MTWVLLPALYVWVGMILRASQSRWTSNFGRLMLWPPVQVATALSSALHLYSVSVAWLCYRFPHYLDHKLTQIAQARRLDARTSRYRYRPLLPGQIRLLRLTPRTWLIGGPIHLRPIHVTRQTTIPYTAVSYHWGGAALTEIIYIDGYPLSVTATAFKVLRACRSSSNEQTIWIDAICINQDDLGEKTEQVQHMSDIYSRATRVVLYPSLDWYARAAAPTLNQLMVAPQALAGHPRGLQQLVIGKHDSWRKRAVVELLLSEYFRRMWVVQEITAGKNVQLYYGGYYIPWIMFFEFLVVRVVNSETRDIFSMLSGKNIQTFQDSSTFLNIYALHGFWMHKLSQASESIPLDIILLQTSKFHATDPQDLVFALIGISDCAKTDLLRPDYLKSPEQVFVETSRFLLTAQEVCPLHLLTLGGIGYNACRRPIPSWAMDRSEYRPSNLLVDAYMTENTFRAAGNTIGLVREDVQAGAMLVDGVLLDDSIAHLSTAGVLDFGGMLPGEKAHSSKFAYCKKIFFKAAVELVGEARGDISFEKESFNDDLWQTLIAGRVNRELVTDQRWKVLAHALYSSFDWINVDDGRFRSIFDQVLARYSLTFEPLDGARLISYNSSFVEACFGRRFAMTTAGRLCLVPPLSEPGDMIFIPLGSQVPYLIRTKHESRHSRLVGEAYVHSVMLGEQLATPYAVTTVTLG
ncbi:putative heterokaryon incompatibility [Septoria linicola]|nr:putative heterokaryon incompatibility [Septoria linicola]